MAGGRRATFTAQSRPLATDDTRVKTSAQRGDDDRKPGLSDWEGSPFGIAFLNAEGHVVDSNEALQAITGYSPSELAVMPVSKYTHPDDDPESVSNFRRLIAGEIDSYRLETRLLHKGGGESWVDGYIRAIEGEPRAAIAMVQDITSRKLAELALREQNARLSRVVETQAEIAAADLDLDGVAQLIAERAQELTGADSASVSILDGDELVTRAAIGSTAPAVRISVPLLHRRAGRRLTQRGEGRRRHGRGLPHARAARRPALVRGERGGRARGTARAGGGAHPLRDDLRERSDRDRPRQPRRPASADELGHARHQRPERRGARKPEPDRVHGARGRRRGDQPLRGDAPGRARLVPSRASALRTRAARSSGSIRRRRSSAAPTGGRRAPLRWLRTLRSAGHPKSSCVSRRRSMQSASSPRASRTTSTTSSSACSATPSSRRLRSTPTARRRSTSAGSSRTLSARPSSPGSCSRSAGARPSIRGRWS